MTTTKTLFSLQTPSTITTPRCVTERFSCLLVPALVSSGLCEGRPLAGPSGPDHLHHRPIPGDLGSDPDRDQVLVYVPQVPFPRVVLVR